MVTWEDIPDCRISSLPPFFPSFRYWAWCHMVLDIPLVSWGQLSWLSPSGSLCPASPSLAGLYEKQRSPWLSASTTLQQLKHKRVFSTIFITNPKYSTIWTTMKKIKYIPIPNQHNNKQTPSVLHFLQVGAFYLQCLLPIGLFALLS